MAHQNVDVANESHISVTQHARLSPSQCHIYHKWALSGAQGREVYLLRPGTQIKSIRNGLDHTEINLNFLPIETSN